MSRLALGTAQFGSDYGITNRRGQVDEAEAGRILALAREGSIDCIDTARLYDESEALLGRHEVGRDFRIVTKTRTFAGVADVRGALQKSFEASLRALRRDRVHGLLVHDARELLGPVGPDLWASLEELKVSGRVQKIGLSVYDAAAIDAALGRYPIDIIQLPFNALDRRLLDGGELRALSQAGVEVHARSIFLQGLLLTPPSDLPSKFAALRPALDQLDQLFSANGLTRLEGLLAVALARSEIRRIVVGVTSADELRAILRAASRAETAGHIEGLPDVDERFLDPSRWSEIECSVR